MIAGKCSSKSEVLLLHRCAKGIGFASVQLEKCSFCAGRDGRLRSESHHSEGQWEAAFVAMLLGSCSSQLAEEERSYWIVLAVPSVGVRGT